MLANYYDMGKAEAAINTCAIVLDRPDHDKEVNCMAMRRQANSARCGYFSSIFCTKKFIIVTKLLVVNLQLLEYERK